MIGLPNRKWVLKSIKQNKKTIGLSRKLQNSLARKALITIYEAFARPHLELSKVTSKKKKKKKKKKSI